MLSNTPFEIKGYFSIQCIHIIRHVQCRYKRKKMRLLKLWGKGVKQRTEKEEKKRKITSMHSRFLSLAVGLGAR